MKFQEFGEIVEKAPKFEEFGEVVKEGSQTSRTRSLISAPVKGLVKGAASLASTRDPIMSLLGLSDLSPMQAQVFEKILPTREEPLEKGLERAGKLAVSAIGGPESLALKGARVAGGAALGQLAEETGLPEWAQNLAELSAFMAPKFGKKLIPRKTQQEAVDFLRSKGFSDKEITPLIQSEKKLSRLLPLAEKNRRTQMLAKDIGEKLGQNYEVLKETGKGLPSSSLRGDKAIAFDDALESVLDKINPRFKRLIAPDLADLRNKGISTDNLINFYQDINAIVKGQEGGKAVLGKLKPTIIKGLHDIDPKIAKDFTRLNEFYSKKARLSEGLDKDIFDQLLAKGKSYATAASIASGNFGALKGLIAKAGFEKLFSHLLTNPRLQNISNQMMESMKANKIPQLMKYYEIFKKELSKEKEEE